MLKAVAAGLLGTLAYVLLLPGPIAYERFRAPILSLIVALIAIAAASGRDIAGSCARQSPML